MVMMGAARAAPAEARAAMETEEEAATQAVTGSSERAADLAAGAVESSETAWRVGRVVTAAGTAASAVATAAAAAACSPNARPNLRSWPLQRSQGHIYHASDRARRTERGTEWAESAA